MRQKKHSARRLRVQGKNRISRPSKAKDRGSGFKEGMVGTGGGGRISERVKTPQSNEPDQ